MKAHTHRPFCVYRSHLLEGSETMGLTKLSHFLSSHILSPQGEFTSIINESFHVFPAEKFRPKF